MTISCPRCGSLNLRFSHKSSPWERIQSLWGTRAIRCRDCRNRFHGRVWRLSDLRYARCSRCLRMDLSIWSESHYRVPAYKSILVLLGGNPYRCEYCRRNFVSFRSRKERFVFRKEAPAKARAAAAAGSSKPSTPEIR